MAAVGERLAPLAIHAAAGQFELAASEGKYEEARGHFERALAIWEKALGPDHPDVAYPLTGLGQALNDLDEPAEALPHLERALTLRSSNEGDPALLAELARTAFAEAGERTAEELEEVERWLRDR